MTEDEDSTDMDMDTEELELENGLQLPSEIWMSPSSDFLAAGLIAGETPLVAATNRR